MGGQNINESTDATSILISKAHTIQHSATSTVDHTFPSGTVNYLRADGTWAEPPTGGGTPSGTVLAETTWSISAGAGTSSEYSRGDHTHGMPANPGAGTPSGTSVALTAYGASSASGTSTEYSRGDHSHGSVADLVTGTAHVSLSSGIHNLGTIASLASADFATTTVHAAHTTTDASHGAGTIASVAAVTAQITTHAGSTDAHIGGAGTVLSKAAATVLITTHSDSTGVHGAGTIAGLADIVTHAGSASNVHGSGTATLATTANITTHAALTSVHSLNTASTAASASYALTTTYAAHTIDTAAHLGGAGTVASSAAVTALITTHSSSIASSTVHGREVVLASGNTISSSVMTNISGLVVAATLNSKYVFQSFVSSSCSLTAGVQYSFGYTGSNATVEAGVSGRTFAGSADFCAVTTFATKSGVTFNRVAATAGIFLTGVVVTAGTAGNFSIQHCSASASGTVTARANSYLEWVKIV